MKRARITAVLLTMALLLTACGTKQEGQSATQLEAQAPTAPTYTDVVEIMLSDNIVSVGG